MARLRNLSFAALGGFCLLAIALLAMLTSHWFIPAHPFANRTFSPKTPPQPVLISGYQDDAMEPFITRDGRYLLFNNLNDPKVNTDIFFAGRQDDFTWQFRGPVRGINTPALEGCATMDRNGRMFFVSPRSYRQTLCTIYTGHFQAGIVTNVQIVDSLSLKQPGIVNFDVDVSSDGRLLVFVDSRFRPFFLPKYAHLVMANWEGTNYVRSLDSARLLVHVNQANMVYAPTISASKLTLFFTCYDPHSRFRGPQIYRTTRPTLAAPFGLPEHVAGLGEYVEGSALGPDERILYYHSKVGGKFRLYAVLLP